MNNQENITDTDILTLSNKRLCLCGCQTVIDAIDSHGRPRHFVLGHNRRNHKTRDPLLTEIRKIKSLDEAYCIMQTQAFILKQQERKIESIKKVLDDNNIPYRNIDDYDWMDG